MREEIISGCETITKSKLSGRIQSTLLKHMHSGFRNPVNLKTIKLIQSDACKLCSDKETTYTHIFIYCAIGRFVRLLLQERFYRATNQILQINMDLINIFKLPRCSQDKSLKTLTSQFIGAYKYVLHKHYHTGYPNVEISNTKLPLDLTNKILEIVSRADDWQTQHYKIS